MSQGITDNMANDRPAVSVVVPAFNPGRYLHEALASVTDQTFAGWEAIVVDDGSTEDLSWVDDLDPRIRRVRQHNAGLSAARNTGISASRADVVALLDADDIWLPDKLARQLAAFDDPEVAMASTAFTMIDSSGAFLSAGYDGHADSYHLLLQGNGICASSVALRRDVVTELGGFDTSLSACEDWDMWLRLAAHHKLVKIPEVLARYRLHGGNMSRDYRNLRRNGRRVLRRQITATDAAERREVTHFVKRGLRRIDALIAAQSFDAARASGTARPMETIRHLGHSLMADPHFAVQQLAGRFRSG